MSNLLDNIDFDSPDLAALPADKDQQVIDEVRRVLDTGSAENWLDLYFAGADAMRYMHPDLPLSTIHKSVTLIVAKVIEDAI